MPHATESEYQLIHIEPIGPTIGAEVSGVDFTKPVTPEVFAEIHKAITKVCCLFLLEEGWAPRQELLRLSVDISPHSMAS